MTEVLIVGAGIAGASLGAALAAHGPVTLIEMEAQPGYHATGRSVAFWTESYGGPGVQPLTSASGPMLAAAGVLHRRGAVHIGRAADMGMRDALLADFAGSVALAPVDPRALVPGLRPEWNIGVAEPSCADIDAAALHAACLAAIRRAGGRIATATRLLSAEKAGQGWRVETTAGRLSADILVNAAGAWADEVAVQCGVAPLGIRPYRRTVVQLRTDPAPSPDGPVVLDLAGRFYFKPEGHGRLWLSPHDEVPSDPCDAAPEEMAVAEAIDRFQSAVDWRVEAVERRWAGLRSFAPDRLPVYGFDAQWPGFFWCAGQGGFGIQTAPAAAALCAALLTGAAPPPAGIDPAIYAPERFARAPDPH